MKLENELTFESTDGSKLKKANLEAMFKIGSDTYLISDSLSQEPDLLSSANREYLYEMLKSKVASKFHGKVIVDTGYGVKTLFFKEGQLVFAASDAIDDRLGEILYRRGTINLDQLTDAAVQVTPALKFGQVLVNQKILRSTDVWDSLKQQIIHILRTVFMPERTLVKVFPGEVKLFAEVFFIDGTYELLQKARTVGTQVGLFKESLRSDTKLKVNEAKCKVESLPEGTFARDFFELIAEQETVEEILKASKLSELNTLASLFELAQHDYINHSWRLEGAGKLGVVLAPFESVVSDYKYLVQEIKMVFGEAGVELPESEIRAFGEKIGTNLNTNLGLEADLSLSDRSIDMLKLSILAKKNCVDVVATFTCLMQFVRLLAADHLSSDYYAKIREIQFEQKEAPA